MRLISREVHTMDEKKQNDQIQLFENQKIRTAWDAEQEEWYFSVVDVVGALTDQSTPRGASTYWAVLKKRLKEEGADQLLTNCKQLKMKARNPKGFHQSKDVTIEGGSIAGNARRELEEKLGRSVISPLTLLILPLSMRQKNLNK